MKNSSTPEQLADAIESMVASYMDEFHLAVQRAVERSLSRSVSVSTPSKGVATRRSAARSATKRRSSSELEEVCAELCKRVRAQPGASMIALAEEMKMPTSALQRPMAKLRSEGRVRSVGERHLTRYFPAVVRVAAGKE